MDVFAGALSGLQTRMGPHASRAPGLWQALQAAQGRVDSAKSADSQHSRAVALRTLTDPGGSSSPPDTYHSDSPAASAALSTAQREWNDCLGAARAVKSDLNGAINTCVNAVNAAADTRFKHNPSGWGALVAGFKNFVKDHVAGLAKLSGVLKLVSGITGVLSFIPVIGEGALAISLVTGAAAVAIDASIKYATGRGSWMSIAIDAGSIALPFGKGLDALRDVKGAETVVEDVSRLSEPIEAPYEGQTVYRVFGQNQDAAGHMMPSGSRIGGESWTPVDPTTSADFRWDAGLPDENPGRFYVQGVLRDPSAVSEVRPALPLDGNPGGWPEYVIHGADNSVEYVNVGGVNEPWTHGPGDWTPPAGAP
ncbi:MAG TPA: hypothetical protein VFX70_15895 [Mycobacteriales bacterium]|nr:hypothetical protein [Mycobacteriales bacterium]